MRERDEMHKCWELIPDDVEILITHGPAYGIMDECPNHAGCEALLDRIKVLRKNKLRVHIFGHIHTQGCKRKRIDKMTFMNVATLNDYLKVNDNFEPQIIEFI